MYFNPLICFVIIFEVFIIEIEENILSFYQKCCIFKNIFAFEVIVHFCKMNSNDIRVNITLKSLESNITNKTFDLIGDIFTDSPVNDFLKDLCHLSYGCYLRRSITWTIAYLIAYLIVFLIGLIGNLSVLWIIYAIRKQTNNSVSVSSNKVFYRFVGNLALADLLVVIFCLPPTLIGNIFGRKSTFFSIL